MLFAAPAGAQGPVDGEGSMQVGNATVTVGGGTAILTLPDVPSLVTLNQNNFANPFIRGFKLSNDFGDEVGWNVNGSIEAPIDADKAVSLNGFWAKIDDNDSAKCDHDTGANVLCFWFPLNDNDPGLTSSDGESIISNAERDVDQWGVSLEVKRALNPGVMGLTQAPPRRYLALGADVRGIDQNLDVNLRWINGNQNGPATYMEDLDTLYYGAYAAWGGDIDPFLFKGMWERWGLQSSFTLRGGLYYADSDYDGRIVDQSGCLCNRIDSALSLSDDDFAFIGGLVTETRKRIGQRTVLSLQSSYEYYSYVPEMAYNTFKENVAEGGQEGTRLGSDDAFSMRTSLRLTVKLGPDSVFEGPLK